MGIRVIYLMTTKEEQDQRPLCRGARHTETVLKQQTRFPSTLGRRLALQPLCTHRPMSTRCHQLMPRRGLLYGCQACWLWDLGCAVGTEQIKVHAHSHPFTQGCIIQLDPASLSILISLGCAMAQLGTAANKTTRSSHPCSGFDPLLPLGLHAQPTSWGAGGLLFPSALCPTRLCLPQLVLPPRDAHA